MDTENRKSRYILCFFILAGLLCLSACAGLFAGSVDYSANEIISIILGKSSNATAISIIKELRIPRIAAAIILGGGLSVSGFLLQTFFANPIAGPFVLGISSGAKLTVALSLIFFLQNGTSLSSGTLIFASFIGSMISTGFILAISGKIRKSSMLIVCGVMIGYISSAITDLVITFADDSNIVNLHNWSLGSFAGTDRNEVKTIAAVITAAVAVTFLLSKQIGAYQLGEVYAQSVGVNIKLFRATLILLSSLLSATVTAFAGPVSFVGIAVPHLMRSLFRTSSPRIIIPACFLGGAVFCLVCDIIARTLFAPSELSISSVTAIFGAPVVIWIMLRRKAQ